MSFSEKVVDFLHSGDLVGMHNTLAKAINQDNLETLSDLAEYLQMMGFLEESRQVYEKIEQMHPSDTGFLINLAEMAEADGDLDKALEYLYQVAPNDDNYLAALVQIADIYQADGDFETAISKLEEAKEISNLPLIKFALAESYYAQGEFAPAIKEYDGLDAAEILSETKISIHQRIGDSYAQLGMFEEAIEALEKALEIENKAEIIFEIALLHAETEQTSRAIQYFKELDSLEEDFMNYELPYAQALEEDGQFELALGILKQGLSKNPNDVSILHFASRIAHKLHDSEQAESYLMNALDIPEMHDESVFLLANLYYQEEDYDAIVNLDGMLDDEHLLAQWILAQAYKELEEDDKAEEKYAELLQTDLIENPEFLKDYIEFLSLTGKRQDLEKYIRIYLELAPDDEEMRGRLD